MRTAGVLLLAALLGNGGKSQPPPPAPRIEHLHPSGAFTFRTPETWKVQTSLTNPDILNAGEGALLIRFYFKDSEVGYDALHGACMLERLAGPMDMDRIKFDYDFIDTVFADRRALDSVFEVHYDKPILGYQDWRQRNLTIVGAGQSLCAITYIPVPLWKKSRESRTLLEDVLKSVTFRSKP